MNYRRNESYNLRLSAKSADKNCRVVRCELENQRHDLGLGKEVWLLCRRGEEVPLEP